MIIRPQKILIQWSPSNTKNLIEKGYKYTKLFELVEVNIDDLQNTSRKYVDCKCEVCDKIYQLTYGRALEKERSGKKFECKKCGKWSKDKEIKKNENKKYLYGFDFHMQKNYFEKIYSSDKKINELYGLFKKRGYFLFKNQKYINNREKLKYLCLRHGIKRISWGNFQKGKGCRECGIARGSYLQSLRKTKDQIKKEVEDLGYIYAGNETYKNINTRVTIICPKHMGVGKKQTRYRDIQKNNILCKLCSRENTGKKFMSDARKEQFNDFFKRNNLTLLKPLDYNGVHCKYYYRCNKHPEEGVMKSTFNQMTRKNTQCEKCYSETYSGKGSPNWKGTRCLYDFLRGSISDWKQKSMELCNFKCIITGEDFDEIHHLYPFNQIVNEVVGTLNLKSKDSIEDYSDDELNKARCLCLELHFKYGLGVCLKEKIHKEFHLKYGFVSFSRDDFIEFCKEVYNINI